MILAHVYRLVTATLAFILFYFILFYSNKYDRLLWEWCIQIFIINLQHKPLTLIIITTGPRIHKYDVTWHTVIQPHH